MVLAREWHSGRNRPSSAIRASSQDDQERPRGDGHVRHQPRQQRRARHDQEGLVVQERQAGREGAHRRDAQEERGADGAVARCKPNGGCCLWRPEEAARQPATRQPAHVARAADQGQCHRAVELALRRRQDGVGFPVGGGCDTSAELRCAAR
eukprot:6561435-Prymnesium_polylepis.2